MHEGGDDRDQQRRLACQPGEREDSCGAVDPARAPPAGEEQEAQRGEPVRERLGEILGKRRQQAREEEVEGQRAGGSAAWASSVATQRIPRPTATRLTTISAAGKQSAPPRATARASMG